VTRRAIVGALLLTIAIAAALVGGLLLAALVGTSLLELTAPDTVESTGPSPWLVLSGPTIVLFLVALWTYRRAEKLLAAAEHRIPERRRAERWLANHPAVRGFLLGAVGLASMALTFAVLGVPGLVVDVLFG
jgi:H+/Cl- antiporter ClcA